MTDKLEMHRRNPRFRLKITALDGSQDDEYDFFHPAIARETFDIYASPDPLGRKFQLRLYERQVQGFWLWKRLIWEEIRSLQT